MHIKVKERQKWKKISQLKHYASVDLTCMESFGLHLTLLEGVTDAEEATTLQLNHPLPSSSIVAASGGMCDTPCICWKGLESLINFNTK